MGTVILRKFLNPEIFKSQISIYGIIMKKSKMELFKKFLGKAKKVFLIFFLKSVIKWLNLLK